MTMTLSSLPLLVERWSLNVARLISEVFRSAVRCVSLLGRWDGPRNLYDGDTLQPEVFMYIRELSGDLVILKFMDFFYCA